MIDFFVDCRQAALPQQIANQTHNLFLIDVEEWSFLLINFFFHHQRIPIVIVVSNQILFGGQQVTLRKLAPFHHLIMLIFGHLQQYSRPFRSLQYIQSSLIKHPILKQLK